MLLKTITLASAAFVLACSALQTCYSDTKYSLTMMTGTDKTATSLHALDNGSDGSVILVAGSDPYAPGTPICEDGLSPNVSLNLEVTDTEPFTTQTGIFHLSVPDMGEVRGSASTVSGNAEYDWPHWSTGLDSVWPKMTSAAQLFFACNVTIADEQYTALSWGLFTFTGGNPPDCYSTVVKKRYDVQVPC